MPRKEIRVGIVGASPRSWAMVSHVPAINVREVYAHLARDLRPGTCITPGFQHALQNARLIETVRRAGERGERQHVLVSGNLGDSECA